MTINQESEIFGTPLCGERASGCAEVWSKICRLCLTALCEAHLPGDRHKCRGPYDPSPFYKTRGRKPRAKQGPAPPAAAPVPSEPASAAPPPPHEGDGAAGAQGGGA